MNDQCNQAAAPRDHSKRLRIAPCQNGGFLVEREGERHLQTDMMGAYSNARDMIEALMAEFDVDPSELMRFEPPRVLCATTEDAQPYMQGAVVMGSASAARTMVDEGRSMSADDLKAYTGSSTEEDQDQAEPIHTRMSVYVIGDQQEITLSPGEDLYSMMPCQDGGLWIVTQQSLTETEIMAEMHRAAKEAMQGGLN